MPGIQEWIVIAFVALVVLGPERLPRVARTAGKLLARFRSETRRNVEELKRIAELQDLEREVQGLRQELHGTREELRSTVSGRPGRAAGAGRPTAARASSVGPVRADDDPPPVDLEAT